MNMMPPGFIGLTVRGSRFAVRGSQLELPLQAVSIHRRFAGKKPYMERRVELGEPRTANREPRTIREMGI